MRMYLIDADCNIAHLGITFLGVERLLYGVEVRFVTGGGSSGCVIAADVTTT